jgi:long-subunit acyl-CoA synthetase (AMP-forming)
MTESAGMACGNIPFDNKNIGTIGKSLSCIEMKISKQGEILIRGDAVFSGYYLADTINKEVFDGGWFKTGDIAKQNEQGVFTLIGRIKDQFKTSKGKYVAPAKLECLLSESPLIEQICVVGSGLKQPVGLLVLADGYDKQDEAGAIIRQLGKVLDKVNEQVEKHEKIDCLFICNSPWTIENDLLTPSLKIKRYAIEKFYQGLVAEGSSKQVIWQ